jgi:hypothetical protein
MAPWWLCGEVLERDVMPKPGASLVALDAEQRLAHVAAGGARGVQRLTDPFDTGKIDLGLGQAERDFVARGARALAGDPPRAGFDLAREGWIGQHGNAQPVPARIPRGLGLAGGRARAGAASRVLLIGINGGAGPAGAVPARRGK